MTNDILDVLLRQSSILLQEADGGHNWNCLYASLVQICLFKRARSQHGFQALIDREWVNMGHNFPLNRGHMHPDDPVDTCHLFALFIDCVFQIMSQYPLEFQFSQDYLIAILDASAMPCYIEFSFSSEDERCSKKNRRHLSSVWEWGKSLSEDVITTLFSNYLYKTAYNFNSHRRSRTALTPLSLPVSLEFWSHAYLRWVDFSNILRGGPANTNLCYWDIYTSLQDAEREEDVDGIPRAPLHSSSVDSSSSYGGGNQNSSSGGVQSSCQLRGDSNFIRTLQRNTITSGFPYTLPTKDLRQRTATIYQDVHPDEWSVSEFPSAENGFSDEYDN